MAFVTRVHFALADLRNEIKAACGSEDDPEVIVMMKKPVLDAVVAELANAMGQQITAGDGGILFHGIKLLPIAEVVPEEESHG